MARQVLHERVFNRLAELPNEASRIRFATRLRLLSRSTVERLNELVDVQARADLKKARALADAAISIAKELGDRESLGFALRAKANVLSILGHNRRASRLHARAVRLFEKAGNALETGRTLSTSIQPLILLGEYDRAHTIAKRSQEIFSAAGENLRLARLQINIGNIFHRQDRFREALDCYQQAHSQLLPAQDAEGVMAALHNAAICLTMLSEDERAMEAYQEVSRICRERKLPVAAAQAEYNVAYLHYLRGRYAQAIEMLRVAHKTFQNLGDAYHVALTDLDLAEIYLELNLSHRAGELAQQALTAFERLGMRYEAAKSLCLLAIAQGQGRMVRSIVSFTQARTMFVKEQNQVWPALIDFYQALAYFNQGQMEQSRLYCFAALVFFRDSALPGKAILCHLLLARLALKAGDVANARKECGAALAGLTGGEIPIVVYQTHLVMGQIEEAVGNFAEAKNHYRNARAVLETLRDGLYRDELKISFLQNKLEVYEGLVDVCLASHPTIEGAKEAWTCMEEAKSRTLLESIVGRDHSSRSDAASGSGVHVRIVSLRAHLNSYYHRVEAEQLAQKPVSDGRLLELRRLAATTEKELLQLLREVPADEGGANPTGPVNPVKLEMLRETLGPDTMLVEYFRTRDRILATIISTDGLEVVPVTTSSRVTELLHALQYQFAKFNLGEEYVQRFHRLLLETTQSHLHQLYKELIGPIRGWLKCKHLVVVPHECLHCVPFHALFDGARYLSDFFTLSYAPSASIYRQCHHKTWNKEGPSLILGVPDPLAPCIDRELQSAASLLPDARLFVGPEAREKVLREQGPHSRLIHIATHGFFRQDMPMFSGIRLGDTFLTLYDLYQLVLPVDHVTLSGCSTGVNALAGGDEIIGLMRGLLFAGARSLLLSLWDVNDSSTAAFMAAFYTRYFQQSNRALALQGAMQELREQYPHPYYWAPFILVGDMDS